MLKDLIISTLKIGFTQELLEFFREVQRVIFHTLLQCPTYQLEMRLAFDAPRGSGEPVPCSYDGTSSNNRVLLMRSAHGPLYNGHIQTYLLVCSNE